MKKHILLITAILCIALSVSSIAGCAGKSAYDIAVENGFVGSESEWLASLVGKDGEKGEKGDKGDTGDKGDKGDRGLTGWEGEDGTHVVDSYIDERYHLMIKLNDGSVLDAGYIGLDRADIGKIPTLTEKSVCISPRDIYILESNLDYPVWSSSDPNVARIDAGGLIIGMNEGRTTITATSVDGKTASCEIVVLDLEYSVNANGGAVVTSYNGGLSEVMIPDTLNGNPVTEIGEWAFFDNSAVEKVVLPNSVMKIGYGAFSTCYSLKEIDLGESLVEIGNSAFSDCPKLSSITLPKSLTILGNAAFFGCSSLTEITVPAGVKTIKNAVFEECSSLSLVIMGNVEFINDFAFFGCRSLKNITLPKSLLKIGESAFAGCEKLASVSFGNENTVYGKNAFEGCEFQPIFSSDGYLTVDVTMYTVSNATARSAPSVDATAVKWPAKGSAINIVAINLDEEWAKVNISGSILYMKTTLLTFSPEE